MSSTLGEGRTEAAQDMRNKGEECEGIQDVYYHLWWCLGVFVPRKRTGRTLTHIAMLTAPLPRNCGRGQGQKE